MTEEEKTCNCKECCKKVKEFAFISGAVFVGGTLAILLGTALTKPKMPPVPPMMPPVGVERQIPPMPPIGMNEQMPPRGMDRQMPPRGHFEQKGQRPDGFKPGDFKGKPQKFDKENFPKPPVNEKK